MTGACFAPLRRRVDPEALSPRKGGKTNIVIIGNPLEEPEHEPEPKVDEDREGEEHDDW